MIEFREKLSNPSRAYESPAHVLLDADLTHEQKRLVLESWRLDAERMAESANEGMAGGVQSRLREVAMAQQQLAALVSD
ncbi:MAG: hypothetical protein NW200_15455 [Hyphomonadaceae bacterium]|nr:hypothetical protein [Hyphomonadaceae bacterium]